jgi:hypothetical protein
LSAAQVSHLSLGNLRGTAYYLAAKDGNTLSELCLDVGSSRFAALTVATGFHFDAVFSIVFLSTKLAVAGGFLHYRCVHINTVVGL